MNVLRTVGLAVAALQTVFAGIAKLFVSARKGTPDPVKTLGRRFIVPFEYLRYFDLGRTFITIVARCARNYDVGAEPLRGPGWR